MHGEDWTAALLLGAVVLLVALSAVGLSRKLGLPTLLAYLGLGLVLGENAAGLEFDDATLARNLGYAALVVILAEGGLTTEWRSLRRALPAAAALSTVGVAISVGVTAVAARLVLGDTSWTIALLLGAILASTDAAAVFSTVRNLPLSRRVVRLLEAESGTNDPLAVILVVGLASGDWTGKGAWLAIPLVAYEIGAGVTGGLLAGLAGRAYLRRAALPASGLYPLAVFAFVFLAYAGTAVAHGSGFLAVYVTALVLGNSALPHRPATRAFAEGLAWLAQIGLFVMLGLLATPTRLGAAIAPALAIGAALMVIARPLSVFAATAPFRLTWRERTFTSWAGLRGAVPIVLATVPLTEKAPGAQRLFDIVFVLVVVFTLVQAPTLPAVARRLGVLAPEDAADLAVEAAPLERIEADLLHLTVGPESKLHGAEVWELRLPERVSVTLVVRGGTSFVPDRWTRLRHGDQLLVVAPRTLRAETEHRLRAVGRRGRLAGWLHPPE